MPSLSWNRRWKGEEDSPYRQGILCLVRNKHKYKQVQLQVMAYICPGCSAGREEEMGSAGEALGKTTEKVIDRCPSGSRRGILAGRGDLKNSKY